MATLNLISLLSSLFVFCGGLVFDADSTQLQQDVTSLRSEFNKLAESVLMMQIQLSFVADPDTSQLRQEVAFLKTEVTRMRQSVFLMQTQLNATSDLAAKANAVPHADPVAFTASISQTISNIPQHQHVVFDNVIINLGGAYNKVTGHFTAPVFGLYSFTLTITNTPGHSASLSLIQNGQQKAVGLAHGSAQTPGQWETSTISAALVLNKGDEVWAQNEGSFSPQEDVDGYNYSSFTGHLVSKI